MGHRASWPVLLTVISGALFVFVRPGVADLWAALARQEAARDGVGLAYWFGWYAGGAVPGNYSLLSPAVSAVITAPVLVALSAVAVIPLVSALVDNTRYPRAAVWTTAVAANINLWSGRVAFVFGCALGVAALLALTRGRRIPGLVLAVASALTSPVSGVFLALGLFVDWWVGGRKDHTLALAALADLGALGAIAVWFGTPGPQGFGWGNAAFCAAALLFLLIARPSRRVTVAILLAVAAMPVCAVLPNGMGSNLERLLYGVLPIAVIAGSRTHLRRAMLAIAPALVYGMVLTGMDLAVASAPPSQSSTYQPLVAHLATLPDRANYRVEVAQDGTQASAYELMPVVTLARGFETQVDKAYNPSLMDGLPVDSVAYSKWLKDNAVRYVVASKKPVVNTPELQLVSSRPSYLTPIWSDSNWTLYLVKDTQPIIPLPARQVASTQAAMTFEVPEASTINLRLRWASHLVVRRQVDQRWSSDVTGRATLSPTPDGWTTLTVTTPGTYQLTGSALPLP